MMRLLPAGIRREAGWYSDKAVFITGCDSGFGYSLALHSAEIGMKVCHDSALLFWLIDLTFK